MEGDGRRLVDKRLTKRCVDIYKKVEWEWRREEEIPLL